MLEVAYTTRPFPFLAFAFGVGLTVVILGLLIKVKGQVRNSKEVNKGMRGLAAIDIFVAAIVGG